MRGIIVSLISILFSIPTYAQSDPVCPGRCSTFGAAAYAPVGVMGDHTHAKGEWMFSYRYMHMDMDGNRDGTNRISDQAILNDFMVAPTDMDMDMHMLGAMYAPTNYLTLMAMVPLLDISMNHLVRNGTRFKTKASGLGDIKLSGLFSVYKSEMGSIHLHSGVSLPTGKINMRDNTPAMQNARLPYPMQLGSGTVDFLPGITYLGDYQEISWGAQALSTIRPGRNSRGYRLGNRLEANLWTAYEPVEWISGSLRTNWQSWGNIKGSNSELNPMMIPTADPNRTGGQRLDLGVGVNLYMPNGALKGFRLSLEYLFPLYQDLDGPQLEVDRSWILGAQMTL